MTLSIQRIVDNANQLRMAPFQDHHASRHPYPTWSGCQSWVKGELGKASHFADCGQLDLQLHVRSTIFYVHEPYFAFDW